MSSKLMMKELSSILSLRDCNPTGEQVIKQSKAITWILDNNSQKIISLSVPEESLCTFVFWAYSAWCFSSTNNNRSGHPSASGTLFDVVQDLSVVVRLVWMSTIFDCSTVSNWWAPGIPLLLFRGSVLVGSFWRALYYLKRFLIS